MLVRLDKFLADRGLGTRSEVREILKKSRVRINETVCRDGAVKIDPLQDRILLDDCQITYEAFRYYMLNKPAGVITATTDPHCQTVMDLIREPRSNTLSPVGRLDKDTVGLLLITDDGSLNHYLLSPRKHVDKTYEVTCAKPFDDTMKQALEQGVCLGGGEHAAPASVTLLSENRIHLTIQEGKFHQVKRMLHAVNNEVIHLKRIRMGSLVLDDTLAEGEYRKLTAAEIAALCQGLERS